MRSNWWKNAVVYQIYPRSFCDSNEDGIGDINGIISKLDYLKELGVDVLLIAPIYKSPMRDNGYDISDYREINPMFGTMMDFNNLLRQAHKSGLKIIMDLVVNHTSNEHPWFIESSSSVDSPKRDYYIWRDPKLHSSGTSGGVGGQFGGPPNNWTTWFGGTAWSYDEKTGQYFLHISSPWQPDLNWENPELRNEIYDMMRFWLDKGIDGFRLDSITLISKPYSKKLPKPKLPPKPKLSKLVGTGKGFLAVAQALLNAEKEEQLAKEARIVQKPPELPNGDTKEIIPNGPRVHKFLQEMKREVFSKYNAMTVGVLFKNKTEEAAINAIPYANIEGTELNMIFQHETINFDGDEPVKWNDRKIVLTEFKEIFSHWQNKLFDKAWNSLYWSSHDLPRIVSLLGEENKYWKKSAKMLATCLYFMQGTPFIYQGEELGMTNAPFKDIKDYRDLESLYAYRYYVEETRKISKKNMLRYMRLKSRDSARTPMQWSSEPNAGFTTGCPWIMINPNYTKINAEDQSKQPDSILKYYQELIKLRKKTDIITIGEYKLLLPDHSDLFVYSRTYQQKKLLVVCNFTREERVYVLDDDFNGRNVLITNEDSVKITYTTVISSAGYKRKPSIVLGSYGAVVFLS